MDYCGYWVGVQNPQPSKSIGSAGGWEMLNLGVNSYLVPVMMTVM